jgi:hypothetical protein
MRKEDEHIFLQNLLQMNSSTTSEFIYRASQHGWMFADFHNNSDNKGGTIILIRLDDGDCIGGFTTCDWSSDKDEYKTD